MIVTYQDNFGRISSDAPTMYIYAQNFTLYGDTLYETQSHKIRRVMDLVLRNGVPIIQPQLTKLLTDHSERRIRNEFKPRPVLKKK